MKTVKLLSLFVIPLILVACNNELKKNYSELEEKYRLLTKENESLKSKVIILEDSIQYIINWHLK